MILYILALIFFFLSYILTACCRHLLIKFNVLDFPNDRGMHNSIVPRGGGLAIVISLLLYFFIQFYFSFDIELHRYLILYILVFALTGFLDDIFAISFKPRLLLQFIGSIYLLFFSGLIDIADKTEIFFFSGSVLMLLLVIFLVWFINLYNFMDGIDGLATTQAICFFSCFAFLISQYGYKYPVEDFLIYISILCGFLLWNFHKAKIFLGDVGSCTLGILIGIHIIYFLDIDIKLFYAAIILMGVFIVDATYTLLNRLYRKQSFHSAHNSHAYQNFARKVKSHSLVTSVSILINLFYLFPIANLVFIIDVNPILLIFCSYFPILIGCIYLKAGIKNFV